MHVTGAFCFSRRMHFLSSLLCIIIIIFIKPFCLFFSPLRTSLWNLEDPVLRKMIRQVRRIEHTATVLSAPAV